MIELFVDHIQVFYANFVFVVFICFRNGRFCLVNQKAVRWLL